MQKPLDICSHLKARKTYVEVEKLNNTLRDDDNNTRQIDLTLTEIKLFGISPVSFFCVLLY